MCMLCMEIIKGNMNIKEAASAYVEMTQDEHTDEILKAIEERYGRNPFLDAILDLKKELEGK